MISVGLVGYGYAGRTFHAPLISSTSGLSLDAIVQRTGNEAASAYPAAKIFCSLEEMLDAGAIQLAVIATSNPTHYSIADACLQAGCHVVVDKPFTVSLNEARELVATAVETRRILSVFQNRRWDGDFLTLRKLIDNDRFGSVTRVTSAFDRFRPVVDTTVWRQRNEPGSGILFDLGPHLLDQALVAFGAPEFLTASIRRERKAAVIDDAFDLALEYASGLRVELQASMLACEERPRFRVNGTCASWIKYQLDPQEAALKRGEGPATAKWGQETDAAHGVLTTCDGTAALRETIATLPGNYLAYYENIRDAILGVAPLIVTPQQALHVMELIELSMRSQKERRAVAVSLS